MPCAARRAAGIATIPVISCRPTRVCSPSGFSSCLSKLLCRSPGLLFALCRRLACLRTRLTGTPARRLPQAADGLPCRLPESSADASESLANPGNTLAQTLTEATHCLADTAAELADRAPRTERLPGSIRQPTNRLACGPARLDRLLGRLPDITQRLPSRG